MTAWSVAAVRAMTKAERLQAVSEWVVAIFEDFARYDIVASPTVLHELNAVASSVAKQASALLDGDIDEALRLHDACDHLIATWTWPATLGGPQ